MNKKILLIPLALLLAISLVATGCPAPEPTPTPTPTPTIEPAKYPPAGTYHWRWFDPHGSRELWPISIYIDFAKEVEEATEGALVIDWLTMGEHPFGYNEMHIALQRGYADMVSWETTYSSPAQPLFFLIMMGGILPGNLEKATEMGLRAIDEVYGWQWEEWGAGAQALRHIYPQCVFHHRSTHLTSFESFAGTKVRGSSPFSLHLIETIGAIPILLSFGEVSSALMTGVIDGVVTETLSAAGVGFFDICKFTTNFTDHQSTASAAISKDSWAELDDATKKTFLELSEKYEAIILASLIETSGSAEAKAVEEDGVSFMQWDEIPEDFRIEAVKRIEDVVFPAWIEKGGAGADATMAQLMQIKKEVLGEI